MVLLESMLAIGLSHDLAGKDVYERYLFRKLGAKT